jgi:hypothetical protein
MLPFILAIILSSKLYLGGGEIKENDGEDRFNYDTFGKCHNVPPVQ